MMKVATRRLVALVWCCAVGWAAPPLTTIQDMLYKADGSPFNGILMIEWNSFEAADASNIATHSLTSLIVNGVVRVQLVPTTNASAGASYSVKYNSDGKIQFEETWAVPPSSVPLRLKDVRIAGSGSIVTPPAATEVQEADVVGLLADLAVRPVKAPGYAPSRAVYVDATGALDGVAGNLTDCVRVDGTSGPCGSAGAGFADGETPAGAADGANAAFTLANAPSPLASLMLYRNGLLQRQNLDYTISGNAIAFASSSIPQSGDVLVAHYRLEEAGLLLGQVGGMLRGTYAASPLAARTVSDTGGVEAAGSGRSLVAAEGVSPALWRRDGQFSDGLAPARPQVLCGGTGAGTSATGLTRLGGCTAPAGLLQPGDRVEIRFDYSHEGSLTGFSVEVRWGGSVLVSRGGGATEMALSGRAEAGVHSGGAQLSSLSWGSTLMLQSLAAASNEPPVSPLSIDFLARMNLVTGETVTLRNFTVVRYPGTQN